MRVTKINWIQRKSNTQVLYEECELICQGEESEVHGSTQTNIFESKGLGRGGRERAMKHNLEDCNDGMASDRWEWLRLQKFYNLDYYNLS